MFQSAIALIITYLGTVDPIFFILGAGGVLVIFLIVMWLLKHMDPYKRVERSRDNGKSLRALVLADSILKKNSLDKKARVLKIELELELGFFTEAENDIYRLISFKRPGDGIDSFELKCKLLEPLYEQDKIFEVLSVARDILKLERNNVYALYWLARIYVSQLYFREAEKILQRLILNRPKHHKAHFLLAITRAQLRDFTEALISIEKAIEYCNDLLYKIVNAALYYFVENYEQCHRILKELPDRKNKYATLSQYLFFLHLNGMMYYRQHHYELAVSHFKAAKDIIENVSRGHKEKAENIVLYNESGKINFSSGKVNTSKKPVDKLKITPVEEYYRLKEVAIEAGKGALFHRKSFHDPFVLLDIEGLGENTWVKVNYGFSLVRAERYEEAVSYFTDLHKAHPEVLGIKKIITLVREKHEEKSNRDTQDITTHTIEKATEKVVTVKRDRYELWEYLEEWEKRVIRPYQLLTISGCTTRKRINPLYLFKSDTKFTLDF